MLLEEVKPLVQVVIFQVIECLGFRMARCYLSEDVKATKLMPTHVLQAVLKKLFPNSGFWAHVVWLTQAPKVDALDKRGLAFLWEDVMLEDSDCAIHGVKDNNLQICLLWNRHLGTKWAMEQVRSLCMMAVLYCRARSSKEMFIE